MNKDHIRPITAGTLVVFIFSDRRLSPLLADADLEFQT